MSKVCGADFYQALTYEERKKERKKERKILAKKKERKKDIIKIER